MYAWASAAQILLLNSATTHLLGTVWMDGGFKEADWNPSVGVGTLEGGGAEFSPKKMTWCPLVFIMPSLSLPPSLSLTHTHSYMYSYLPIRLTCTARERHVG